MPFATPLAESLVARLPARILKLRYSALILKVKRAHIRYRDQEFIILLSPHNSFDLLLFSLVDRVESEPKLSAYRNIGNGKDSGSSDENIDELDEFLNDSDGKKRFTLQI